MSGGWASARAPATIANVGPGFDRFSLAVKGPGDRVSIRPATEDRVLVSGTEAFSIPTDFSENTAGIVLAALRVAAHVERPLEVRVSKGIPAGRGLGSSAASAVAAALAFAKLFRREAEVLGPVGILRAAVEGEAAVSGRHYDNVAGALLGGFVAIASTDPLVLIREPVSQRIRLAIAVPEFPLKTAEMRKLLPTEVPLADAISNVGRASVLAIALSRGDAVLAGRCLEDRFAEPRRAPFIPAYAAARAAALKSGATGFAISGSGSSVFALAASAAQAGRAATSMQRAFKGARVAASTFTAVVDNSIPLRAILRPTSPRFSLVT